MGTLYFIIPSVKTLRPWGKISGKILPTSSMASSPRRGRTGDDQEALGSHFESPTPHFFKVINGHSLKLGKISIPTKFVRKYGADMSGSVVLKVPNGEIWNIGLEENEGGLWLDKRWPKFVQHYSIREKYLVEFCHEGDSIFQVTIFDITATEIEYPRAAFCQMPAPAGARPAASRVPRVLRSARSYRLLEAAANFSSTCPYFWVLMTKKYAEKGSVAITAGFMTRNGLTKRSQTAKLQHGDKSWSVKMYYYISPGRGGSFCKGWIKFSKKNHIKEGDVCVFELIKKNNPVFKVTILRGDE